MKTATSRPDVSAPTDPTSPAENQERCGVSAAAPARRHADPGDADGGHGERRVMADGPRPEREDRS
jgi:hypothetical protein